MEDIKSLSIEELQTYLEGIGEKKFRAAQVYEWLPWDREQMAELPDRSDRAACRAFLEKEWFAAKRRDAERFAAAWQAHYPERPLPQYAEAYELSEYARRPTPEEWAWLRD